MAGFEVSTYGRFWVSTEGSFPLPCCRLSGRKATALGTLLDDLIRTQQQRRRDREPERLRGLEVDHQLELRRLLDGEIAGLRAVEKAPTERGLLSIANRLWRSQQRARSPTSLTPHDPGPAIGRAALSTSRACPSCRPHPLARWRAIHTRSGHCAVHFPQLRLQPFPHRLQEPLGIRSLLKLLRLRRGVWAAFQERGSSSARRRLRCPGFQTETPPAGRVPGPNGPNPVGRSVATGGPRVRGASPRSGADSGRGSGRGRAAPSGADPIGRASVSGRVVTVTLEFEEVRRIARDKDRPCARSSIARAPKAPAFRF